MVSDVFPKGPWETASAFWLMARPGTPAAPEPVCALGGEGKGGAALGTRWGGVENPCHGSDLWWGNPETEENAAELERNLDEI
jgi:hypothetical protein